MCTVLVLNIAVAAGCSPMQTSAKMMLSVPRCPEPAQEPASGQQLLCQSLQAVQQLMDSLVAFDAIQMSQNVHL